MSLSEQELKEFSVEALELLEVAEDNLLALEQGAELKLHFDAIFRAFHNLKGAAGMMELDRLQSHMHQLENILMKSKGGASIPKDHLDLFLRGVDATKTILEGKEIAFSFELGSPEVASPSPTVEKGQDSAPEVQGVKILLLVEDSKSPNEVLRVLRAAGFQAKSLEYSELSDGVLRDFPAEVVIGVSAQFGGPIPAALRSFEGLNPDLPLVLYSTSAALTSPDSLPSCYRLLKNCSEDTLVEVCIGAANAYALRRLVTRSIHLLMYQYSDLVEFLTASGKDVIRNHLQSEVGQLVEERRGSLLKLNLLSRFELTRKVSA